MYDTIASERSGMEVRVRVLLRAVGNFVDEYLEWRKTLRYDDMQTKKSATRLACSQVLYYVAGFLASGTTQLITKSTL